MRRVASKFAWRVGIAVALLVPWANAQTADDSTRAAARQLGNTGVEAYRAGDYPTALEKLDKAYRIFKVPSLGLWSARAMVKLGKLVEASERYLEVTRLAPTGGDIAIQKKAQADAEADLHALTPRIPGIVVQVEGAQAADVVLAIDGVRIPSELVGEVRPANPGSHRLEGARGPERVVVDVTIAEGERKASVLRFAQLPVATPSSPGAVPGTTSAPIGTVNVSPSPTGPQTGALGGQSATPPGTDASTLNTAPEPPPPEQGGSAGKWLGWTALGIGAVGLTVSGGTALMALSKQRTINDSYDCANYRCLESERETVDSYMALRMASTASVIAGGALAATGIVLLLTTSGSRAKSAAVVFTPTSAVVTGRF